MGKTWPALDISGDHDLILAAADDYSPTALEERDRTLRIFFATQENRDRARSALTSRFAVSPVDIDDEDWARKSQQDLSPIAVGRITIHSNPKSLIPNPDAIVIPPSMGFGTGHHATTRLCLAALQSVDLRGKFVLDVGTGSGLLAIAAVKLGAARALGIDDDADAIAAANENLGLNHVTNVEFRVSDVMKDTLPRADVVLANLTGALLVRAASRLLEAMLPGGVLIISGVLATERDEVRHAFANQTIATIVQEEGDDAEWLAFTIKSS